MATLVFPTKSPLKSTCARWSKGSLFGHWRSGVAFVQVSCRSTRRGGVREHPAPSGALRPGAGQSDGAEPHCQGAPSTIRCIETGGHGARRRAQRRASGSTQHHQVH
ncbi:hypothetical protein HMPREF1550_01263 [Actinomyces sp. oral taxon 877 str. F0543]|nr:hypothetical protein HMPREF1550_01263 [Actinomyces sp. oral taxon 877 str. F0543]